MLVRATASLRVLEEAIEEQGVPTYVVGGRGYWSQQPVRDGIAYLAALANPLDEEALLGVLASPFCGVGADALILLADAGRAIGGGVVGRPAGRRGRPATPTRSRRSPADERDAPRRLRALLRRRARARGAAARRGAARAGARGHGLRPRGARAGERRAAAREPAQADAAGARVRAGEGRDLRGFLAYAATRDLAAAREGEAPLESEGLDAVRLMTIHRAKGLEFPVVCVADLGRQGAGRSDRLLIGPDGEVGLRLATPGGGETLPALAYERLAGALALEEDAEERRLFYVAMTRARDRLILSGSTDPERQHRAAPGRPAAGLDRARAARRRARPGAARARA